MENITVKNYKNLKNLTIESLGKVNLIVGENNVGKSTFLEAVSIFATNGSINNLKEIQRNRGLNTTFGKPYDPFDLGDITNEEVDNFSSFFSGFQINPADFSSIVISTQCENVNKSIEMKFVTIAENTVKDADGLTFTKIETIGAEDMSVFNVLNKGFQVTGETKKLYIFGKSFQNNLETDMRFPAFSFIHPTQISSKANPLFYDKIALSTLEEDLIKALQIIDPKIHAINFLGNHSSNRIPMVIYKDDSTRYRLSAMGDGINRILTVILAMLNCKDGVFLIDEFDTGLHYSVQTKLWQMVYQLAENLNIQVFATTHSNDCIKSFIEADKKQMGKLIRLEKSEDGIVAVPFNDRERLEFAIENDVEVR